MRTRRRVLLAIGSLALLVGAGLIAGIVAIAHGGSSPEPAAFAHKGQFSALKGAVGKGLAIDGATLVEQNATGKKTVGALGAGDEVIAPLTGPLTPVATPSVDGSFVVYSSWKQLAQIKPDAPGQGLKVGEPVGLPSVRIFDLRTQKDKLIANGAISPAVSNSGAIAYVIGDSQVMRQNVDYTGRVLVADSPSAKAREWTSISARYFPYAWAGDSLLVYKAIQDSEATDLYAYRGPDEARLLAPNAFVIALSPDGTKVLVSAGRRMLEVIRIADGAVESSLALDGGPVSSESSTTPHALMYAGSWRGDRVVANSDIGLVVLNTRDGLSIESVFATPSFPHGVIEPTFADETHIQGWADLANPRPTPKGIGEPAYDNALVSCDLAVGTCAVDQANPARAWARWVHNPSR